MKLRYLNTLVLLSSALVLTACFNSSSSNNDSSATDNQVSTLANKSMDSDPDAIFDPGALASDISKLFGEADADPIDVKDGDTVQSVIKRLN